MSAGIDLFQAAEVDEIKSTAFAAYMPIAKKRMAANAMSDMLSAARAKVSHRHIELLLNVGVSKRDAADFMYKVWHSALNSAKTGAA